AGRRRRGPHRPRRAGQRSPVHPHPAPGQGRPRRRTAPSMRALLQRTLLCGLLLALAPARADEPDYDFQPPAGAEDPAAADAVRDLAGRILRVYQAPSDTLRSLATPSILQLAAGNYPAADDTRQPLRERRKAQPAPPQAEHNLAFDL